MKTIHIYKHGGLRYFVVTGCTAKEMLNKIGDVDLGYAIDNNLKQLNEFQIIKHDSQTD